MDIPPFNPDDYVYVDIETTGLSTDTDAILEVAYAIGNGPVKTLYPDHSFTHVLESANPKALEVNKWIERWTAKDETGSWYGVPLQFDQRTGTKEPLYRVGGDPLNREPLGMAFLSLPTPSLDHEWDEFRDAIKGKTPVGANVHFDVEFIRDYFAPERLHWHHRLLSLGAWGAGVLMSPKTVGFSDLVEHIETMLAQQEHPYYGSEFPQIDHTAAGDVIATRAVHQYLVWEYGMGLSVNSDLVPLFLQGS
jgi:hypothetical protein